MSLQLKCVEFLGGPLDGYLEVIDTDNVTFSDVIRLSINENVVRACGGEPPGPKLPPTSIVFYERRQLGPDNFFVFLGSTYPNEPVDTADWV